MEMETMDSCQTNPKGTSRSTAVETNLVPTGLKVYTQEDEYLQIVNRSSNPLKRFLQVPNGGRH